jgi:hypothetical protein
MVKSICIRAVHRVADAADRQSHGPLTQSGHTEVRWSVGHWALRLLVSNPDVHAWATRRTRRLHTHTVRVALARRLLVGISVSQRNSAPFSLQRCLAV